MKKYVVRGGNRLAGGVAASGAKNAVLKAIVAACLTSDPVEIKNIPLINDFFVLLELVREIGGKVTLVGHTVKIEVKEIKNIKIPLEMGAKIRTSSMMAAPLLARRGEALIPNPGGCRIGARPIDRHMEGLATMGVESHYSSSDGYFHLKTKGLKGTTYRFSKNTHTGTEFLILAAVLANGVTTIENAAEEPEIDDLIALLNQMGANIKRKKARTIIITGVARLHGTSYTIMADRNEVVTFAVLSALTGGKIYIKNVQTKHIEAFLSEFRDAGGVWEEKEQGIRFYMKNGTRATDIVTQPHPGFMTDWQGPWAIFMTQAKGVSTIHETVYESRFGYYEELAKMGAELFLFTPKVSAPEKFYNFNYSKETETQQGLRIKGPTPLHNAVLSISDLRAGATVVIAALIAKGESIVYGAEILERGYESFDVRLRALGADIKVTEDEALEI